MSVDRVGEKDRSLSFDECIRISEEQSPKPGPVDKGREKVESLAHGNGASFESNSAIKANMARELHEIGFDAESIGRVLHTDGKQVDTWIDKGSKGGKADG